MKSTSEAPHPEHDSDSSPHESREAPRTSREAADTSPGGASDALQPLAQSMTRVERVVGGHFPDAVGVAKATLAVAAVGCFGDNKQPTTLIFVAPASAGKSMVLGFMMPTSPKDPLAQYFYRSDRFTAKSWQSHRSDLSEEALAKVDLLPRVKNKTLLTPELAPLFSGRRDELMDGFAVLTRVLDGDGLTSDSGAHGHRGSGEPVNFQWLGATTPLSPEVLDVMATLGPRMLFYNADRPRKSIIELARRAREHGTPQAKQECQAATRDYLSKLYELVPPRSFTSASIVLDEARSEMLALWAEALVRLRAAVTRIRSQGESCAVDDENDDELSSNYHFVVEHPERVADLLTNILRGSALAHGRLVVNDYDLEQVSHIALSSGVVERATAFRALLERGGEASTSELMTITGASRPTTLRYMAELVVVGLAEKAGSRTSRRIRLASDFAPLCGAPRRKAK